LQERAGRHLRRSQVVELVEDFAVQVQVGDDRFAARARDARADERPARWREP
jgi:hypothetical protein